MEIVYLARSAIKKFALRKQINVQKTPIVSAMNRVNLDFVDLHSPRHANKIQTAKVVRSAIQLHPVVSLEIQDVKRMQIV